MKKYINDSSPFPKSLDEIEDHIVSFNGHDRPRYIYPDNNEAGYLGIDSWGQYWNKAVFSTETVGKLDQEKYYSIVVVPVKTDISVGGLPIYGEATAPSIPQLPSAGLRGFKFTIPTHDQTVIRETGLAYVTGSGTVTDESKAWAVDEHVGRLVKNVETGETATITANTATGLTAAGFEITEFDRYQILTITVKARLVYAAEMTSAAEVYTSSYYLAGVINNNTATSFTLTSYVPSADIWDFSAGYFPPPNAAACKNVSSILFCGGGITEQRGLAKYDGTIEAREASASANEEVTVSVTTDDYNGADTSKVVRLTLGSALDSFEDIQVGSYITVTNASKDGNNIADVRVTRVDPDFRWLEFVNNDGQTDATFTVSVPTVTGSGDGVPTTPVPTDDAISEVWEMTCVGTATEIVSDSPTPNPGNTGTGIANAPTIKDSAIAETWTLECTDIKEVYEATSPVPSGTGNGASSVPVILDQDLAVAETFLLTCTGGTEVFTAGSASKTSGTGNGGFEGPTAGDDAVAELWSMECISTPKSYSNTTPVRSGIGSGSVTYLALSSAPTAGAWEVKCTWPTTEKYQSSVSGSWTVSYYASTITASSSVQFVISSTYYSGSRSGWYVSGYTRVDGGSSVSFKVFNGYSSGLVYAGGYSFSIPKQPISPQYNYNMSGVIYIGTRASTNATFTVTGPYGVVGTMDSGYGTYSFSDFSIAISDGYTRWALNDKFTFNITSTTLAGATFSVTGAASGAQANLTSGTYYDNGFFSMLIKDGTVKWEEGAIVQFTTTASAGPNVPFSVVGTTSGAKATLTSGVEYSNDIFSMTVSDGATKWAAGDTITFDVVGVPQNGATFSVTGSVSNEQLSYPLTSGTEYENLFFSILVTDGATKWAVGDTIVLVFSEAAGDGETFEVIGEISRDQAYLTVGEAYSNEFFSMTLPVGATPWALNDKVFFKITKTPQDLEDETMKLFVTRNYIQGNAAAYPTYFTEGLQDGQFVFDADTAIPYGIAWVDPITQKLGLSSKYTGNNSGDAAVTITTDWPLYYSDSKNPHRIRSGAIIDVGDSITGLSSIGDNLLIFCKSSLWRVGIESLGSYPVLISDNIRCPAQFSIVKGESAVAFYDGTGFSVTDGVTAVSVTAYKAKDYLEGINKSKEENIRGVYDRENKRFEFVFPYGDEDQNNYGMYITEGSWNCYPFSRPDCNALWTNYYNGDLRVYHGTSGALTGGDGFVWRHEGDVDGGESVETTINSVSGQFVEIISDVELSIAKGDTVTLYPSVSGGNYKQAIIDDVRQVTATDYIYSLEFLSAYDLTGFASGDKVYIGYIPFDYGIKWTDFSSPQYQHQPRALHIDFEDMDGVLYVDHFKDMSDTPVKTDIFTPVPGDSKIVVPFREGKCYKYGFRLRGLTKTKFKINSFEIMFDTQA